MFAGVFKIDGTPLTEKDVYFLSRAGGNKSYRFALQHTPGDNCAVAFSCGSPSLSISSQTLAAQLFSHRGWALFDGRIDNKDQIISSLRSESILLETPSDVSDADLILCAYSVWAGDCAKHILGDYSFAVWDPDSGLFCARDPNKARPFYYSLHGTHFIWASEPDLILKHDIISADYDFDYLASFVSAEKYRADQTPYAEIKRLCGGSALRVSRRGLQQWQWWELPDTDSLRFGEVEDYYEHLRQILRSTVAGRMRQGEKVGIALSSGIDSSAVAWTALELHRLNPTVVPLAEGYIVEYEGIEESDESTDARRIASHLGLETHSVSIGKNSYFSNMTEISALLAEPSAVAPFWSFWKRIVDVSGANGCNVLLNGLGGDELFYGHLDYMGQMAVDGHWLRLSREIKRWRAQNVPLARILTEILKVVSHPEYLTVWHKKMFPWCRRESRIVKGSDRLTFANPLEKRYYSTFLEMEQPIVALSGSLFEPSGMEQRFPIWDRRLMEFAFSLPLEVKVSPSMIKPVLRKAFASGIPTSMTRRGRLDAYMTHGTYANWQDIVAVLDAPPPALLEVVDVQILKAHVPKLRQLLQGAFITPVICLAFWLRSREI
jgi:asparagine synthase (glutamine-hydrolysing)